MIMRQRFYDIITSYINDDILLTLQKKDEYFIITEDEKNSKIKEVYIVPYHKEQTFIIKQDKKKSLKKSFSIDLLKKIPNERGKCNNHHHDKYYTDIKPWQTNKMCDCIIIVCSNNGINKIYFCEIKSVLCNESLNEAIWQIKASKIFIKYLFHALKDYCDLDIDLDCIDNAKNLLVHKFVNKGTTNASKYDIKPIKLKNKNEIQLEKY